MRKNKILQKITDRFSRIVTGKVYLYICRFLAAVGGSRETVVGQHCSENRSLWKENKERYLTGKYLEYQNLLAQFRYGTENTLYGKLFLNGRNLDGSINTCMVIAVFNALTALGVEADFSDILSQFERKGILLKGYWGTAPDRAASFFKEKGFLTEMILTDEEGSDGILRLAKTYEVFILTAFNDAADIAAQVHTMCITREEFGYVMHNCPDEKKVDFDLKSLIYGYRRGKGKPVCLTGIRKSE